jgi:hypothetical protein
MKRLVAALTVGFLIASGSVAHAGEKVMYQEITDNKPDVGVSTTVYLGDRMLEQRHGRWQECLIPKFESNKTTIGTVFIVKSGEPICKSTIKSKKYDAVSYVNGVVRPWEVNFKPLAGNQFKLCAAGAICTDPRDLSDIEAGPWFVYNKSLFQQTIEYGGRSGDILKFTYSEFTDGYARQAFTREFQVDLTQGKVAAYKGAIIEIESATNSSIIYKVVRNFQQ